MMSPISVSSVGMVSVNICLSVLWVWTAFKEVLGGPHVSWHSESQTATPCPGVFHRHDGCSSTNLNAQLANVVGTKVVDKNCCINAVNS